MLDQLIVSVLGKGSLLIRLEGAIIEHCKKSGLNYSLMSELSKPSNFWYAIGKEKCNLEYPKKGASTHFFANIYVSIEKGNLGYYNLIFSASDFCGYHDYPVYICSLNLGSQTEPLHQDPDEDDRLLKKAVASMIDTAWLFEESCLEKFK